MRQGPETLFTPGLMGRVLLHRVMKTFKKPASPQHAKVCSRFSPLQSACWLRVSHVINSCINQSLGKD